ncbi:MAG TPA: N-acetyl-gamma-glutamyl-phosphate reductase [Ktedonobacterales bacterium]
MHSRASQIPVAVVSGTGYGGVELLRVLRAHPRFRLVEVTARSEVGRRVCDVFPQLHDVTLPFTERVNDAALVFLGLPDHASAELAPTLLAEGRRVVDLSAAFRLRDAALYREWYGYEHPAPTLLSESVYGLPELRRDHLAGARLVAGPGCFPTAALLALAPALRSGLLEPGIIVDAKSGLSGAGRGLKLGTHYSEANEDVSAYGLSGHRHWPEMRQELATLYPDSTSSERDVPANLRLTFVPHLVPMTRGILATCYADPRQPITGDAVREVYAAAYAGEPFVHVVEQPPHTKHSLGTNHAFVHPAVDTRTGRLVVVCAIDNLGKGAAGQARQCANAMYGAPETLGLDGAGLYP